MNNDNIVKIGTALKWRNTFDITKKYYQENVVTVCGCVFRCKVLQAQGKSPVTITDNQGHIVYTNTDVWDVLVDMAYYYNFAVDTKKLTQETLDYVKQLDKAIKKQQEENEEQQREIDSVLDTISCFSEGIWIDTLLWSNETVWDNNKYAITDDLQRQINELTDHHNKDITDINNHIDQHEKDQKIYQDTTDAKLLVLALGAKTTLSVTPNVVHKGVETNITLRAKVNIDDDIDNLSIYQGQRLVDSSKVQNLSHQMPISTDVDILFRAETEYKGLVLPASVTLYARYPIYCGFGATVSDIKNSSHQISARTSAAGNYRAINTKNNQRYYILVPVDIAALSDFTMGGAPYVMNSREQTFDDVKYKIYESGAVYNAGAEVNITAK